MKHSKKENAKGRRNKRRNRTTGQETQEPPQAGRGNTRQAVDLNQCFLTATAPTCQRTSAFFSGPSFHPSWDSSALKRPPTPEDVSEGSARNVVYHCALAPYLRRDTTRSSSRHSIPNCIRAERSSPGQLLVTKTRWCVGADDNQLHSRDVSTARDVSLRIFLRTVRFVADLQHKSCSERHRVGIGVPIRTFSRPAYIHSSRKPSRRGIEKPGNHMR